MPCCAPEPNIVRVDTHPRPMAHLCFGLQDDTGKAVTSMSAARRDSTTSWGTLAIVLLERWNQVLLGLIKTLFALAAVARLARGLTWLVAQAAYDRAVGVRTLLPIFLDPERKALWVIADALSSTISQSIIAGCARCRKLGTGIAASTAGCRLVCCRQQHAFLLCDLHLPLGWVIQSTPPLRPVDTTASSLIVHRAPRGAAAQCQTPAPPPAGHQSSPSAATTMCGARWVCQSQGVRSRD